MATTRKSSAKTTAAKAAENKAAEETSSAAVDIQAAEEPAPVKKAPARKKTLSSLDPNEIVELQSCTEGKLVYASKSGYHIEWSEFGDVHLVPISEIIKMRNEQPAFFRNHWVYPVSDNAQEVINALQLDRYYNKLSDLKNFDDLFDYEPEQIALALRDAPQFMKENVARRCAQLVADGTLDSVAVVEAVEKATGFQVRDNG